MTQHLTRKELLRRAAAGGMRAERSRSPGGLRRRRIKTPLTPPPRPPRSRRSWPRRSTSPTGRSTSTSTRSKNHPSLQQFTKKTGVKVNYVEDINDNESFFGKIEGPLSHGQSIGRDIIVMTDSSGLPARLIQLGWLEKLYKPAIPNIKNLIPVQQHPSGIPTATTACPGSPG